MIKVEISALNNGIHVEISERGRLHTKAVVRNKTVNQLHEELCDAMADYLARSEVFGDE